MTEPKLLHGELEVRLFRAKHLWNAENLGVPYLGRAVATCFCFKIDPYINIKLGGANREPNTQLDRSCARVRFGPRVRLRALPMPLVFREALSTTSRPASIPLSPCKRMQTARRTSNVTHESGVRHRHV